MKTAIPYVPDEFALETDTPLDTSTKLTLSLYAMYNPVPTLAVTRVPERDSGNTDQRRGIR